MSITLQSRRDFTLRNLERVALGGASVRIGSRARRRMRETRASFMALLDEDRTRFIYGTTSGGGHHASKRIAPEEQRAHAARSIWRIPGWGFGAEAVPERVVRMIVFARLANYIEGHAKSRPEVAERIASMLDGPMPRLPQGGQVGAGEILPLFHVMGAMPEGDFEEGEPMAVINGSPVSAGLAADVALTARRRFALASAVFALSVEALGAPLEAYDPALARACPDPHVVAALRHLSRLLRGARRRGRRPYQAPVSWRILPQVLGAALRAVETMKDAAETSISSITDNPVYLPPDSQHPRGRVYSTAAITTRRPIPPSTRSTHATRICARSAITTLIECTTRRYPGFPRGLQCRVRDRPTAPDCLPSSGLLTRKKHAMPRHEPSCRQVKEAASQARMTCPLPRCWPTASTALRAAAWTVRSAILSVAAGQALHVTARRPPPALASLVEAVRVHVPPLVERAPADMSTRLEALASAFGEAAVHGAAWLPTPPLSRTAREARPARRTSS